jgi:hypothetical protein
MADPSPTQAEQIKKLIEIYFQKLHGTTSGLRNCARTDRVVVHDGLAKIALADAAELMSMVKNKEDGDRYAFKYELGTILDNNRVYYLPDEQSHDNQGSVCFGPSFVAASPDAIFPKFGRALREIDCTLNHMQQFMDANAQATHILISAWDMEIYKLQNLCTNLKKEVLKD